MRQNRFGAKSSAIFTALCCLFLIVPNASSQVAREELESLAKLSLMPMDSDTLAFGESFSLGLSHLDISVYNYRTVYQTEGLAPMLDVPGFDPSLFSDRDDRLSLNAIFDLSYMRYQEKERYAWDVTANALVVPYLSYFFGDDRDDTDFTLTVAPSAAWNMRHYPMGDGMPLMLMAGFSVINNFMLLYESRESGLPMLTPFPLEDDGETYWINVSYTNAAFGVGFGRVLNVSPATRLRKIEKYLLERKIISRSIPGDVANTILLHWYELRNEVGYYKHIAYSLKILQDRGFLERSLDYRATYAIQQMIRDGQLNRRDEGWMAAAFLNINPWVVVDRYSDVDHMEWLGTGIIYSYSRVLNEDNVFSVEGTLHADPGVMDSPLSWLVFNTNPSYSYYFYNEYMDPLGSLSVGGWLQLGTAFDDPGFAFAYHAFSDLSDLIFMPIEDGEISLELGVTATYNRVLNRGSSWSVRVDSGIMEYPDMDDMGYYFTLRFGFTYGVAEGHFSSY